MALLTNWVTLGILSAVFAALVAVLAKVGLQHVDATLATTVRAIFMGLMLLAVSLATGRFAGAGEIPREAWIVIVLSGLAGAASWLCYFIGIQLGQASGVAALDRLSIVFVVVFAGLFLGESLDPLRLLGCGLIVAGALLVAAR